MQMLSPIERAPPGPARVRDSRGSVVRLVDIASVFGPGSAELRRATWRGLFTWQLVMFTVLTGASLALSLWSLSLVWRAGGFPKGLATPWRMIPLMQPFLMAGFVLWNIAATRRLRAAHIAAEIVSRHRCAGCGYSLRELAEDADGVRVCPECAAAWRLPKGERPTEAEIEAYRYVPPSKWLAAMRGLGEWVGRRWRGS